ncbi:MAG: hypothetical protein Q7K48_03910 [Fusobacterium sp. JB021]|nr:hypothetical protein [Fusobacterium sp. JB021]MDP0507655.1 hypothetical protein [Fusobacterium sp. JB019]
MKKKILYLLGLVGVLILGYFNYYKEEEGIKEVSTKIETIDVNYTSLGYKIKAIKQIDDTKLNITNFENAEINFKEMELKANNVLLDSAKNIFLENNIYGNNGKNWEFTSEKLSYNQLKDLLSSDTGVKAFNKKEDLEIQSKIFRTNKSFTYIELNEDIVLENQGLRLKADKGRYTSSNKVMILSGNGIIESSDSREDILQGKFEKGRYNSKTGVLEIFSPFEINYNGVILKGKELWYNNLSEEIKIDQEPEIYLKKDSGLEKYEGKEGKFSSDKIQGNLKDMVFNFLGNAKGQIISLDKQTNKKIISSYKGNNLKVYLKKENSGYDISEIKGKEKVVISRDNQVLKSDEIYINLYKNIAFGEKDNKIILNDSKGETIIIGDKFKGYLDKKVFNSVGNVKIENIGKNGKTTVITGDKGTVDDTKKTAEIEGNVKLENDELICTADKVIYNKLTNKVKTFGKTLVNYKSN